VNLIDTRYTNVKDANKLFEKFKDIRSNKSKNYFEFMIDNYTLFNQKAEGTRQDWVICTNDTRIETFRNPAKNNQWDSREVVLTEEFNKLFKDEKYNIDINNLKEGILSQTEKHFFERLLHLLKLTLQMRNSKTGTDIDYLISPVANADGEFYDSRKEINKGKNSNGDWKSGLPVDADANGAYNIARKGLILMERLKTQGVDAFEKSKKNDKDNKSQWLTNKEWLRCTQGIYNN